MESKPGERTVSPHDLRASDMDLERVAGLLRDAHGDGRVTLDEHADRVQRVHVAAVRSAKCAYLQRGIKLTGWPKLAHAREQGDGKFSRAPLGCVGLP